MLIAGGEMERAGWYDTMDERKEIEAVVVWKRRWRRWCRSYDEGRAV